MTQGPLMQCSLTTKIGTSKSTVSINAQIADQILLGYTGVNLGGLSYGGAQFYTNDFLGVMPGYSTATPIQHIIIRCNGTCTGFIRAAGLVPDCTVSTDTYNYNCSVTNTTSPTNQGSGVFSISFFDNDVATDSGNPLSMIGINIFFADLQAGQTLYDNNNQLSEMDCVGPMTTLTCTLRPALIEYPVIITT
jgi:hypothetical protein